MERERSAGIGASGYLLVELLAGTVVCVAPAITTGRLDSHVMAIGMVLASIVVIPAELVRHFGIPQRLRGWWRSATGMLFRSNAASVTTADDLLRATMTDLCRTIQLDLAHAVSEAVASLTVTMTEFEKRMTTAAQGIAQESHLAVRLQEELRREAERQEVMLGDVLEELARLQQVVVPNRMMHTRGLEEATRAAAALAAFAPLHGFSAAGIWGPFSSGPYASVIKPHVSGSPYSPKVGSASPFSVWQNPHHFFGVTQFSGADEQFWARLESHLRSPLKSAPKWEIIQMETREGRTRVVIRPVLGLRLAE